MFRSHSLKRSFQTHLKTLIHNLQQPPSSLLFNPIRTLSIASSPPPSSSSESELRKYLGYTVLLVFCGAATYYSFLFPKNAKHKQAQLFCYAPLPNDLHIVSNWSGTHEVQTRHFHQLENPKQLEELVKESNEKRVKLCPVGSDLSPNGIGLARGGMVNLALMDKVIEVDKEKKRVRIQ